MSQSTFFSMFTLKRKYDERKKENIADPEGAKKVNKDDNTFGCSASEDER